MEVFRAVNYGRKTIRHNSVAFIKSIYPIIPIIESTTHLPSLTFDPR
jgi:hypothetical protein